MNTNNREILQIALPSIVSNITVPLLGLIDVTIVGHLGAASYIGAIAIGGMIFNKFDEKSETIYLSWLVHMFANFATNSIGFLLFAA